MKQSQELSNLESSDEDYLDSIFGFDDHALENLSDDLIVIADRVIRQCFEDQEDFVESGFCVFTLLLCICDAVKLNLQFCLFVHESLCFFFVKGFHIISGNRRGSDGKPEVDPEQAVVVKRIYERFLAGDSLATIG